MAGSNFVPRIRIGAVVVLLAGAGGFGLWPNQVEHGALLQDIDFAISGMAAEADQERAALAKPAAPGLAGKSQQSMA